MIAHKQKSKAIFPAKLEELFGLDLRSLAVFRIGLALIIITDLIIRVGDLTAHYTDDGVLPRGVLSQQILKPWYWSVHALSGQPIVQAILFSLAGLIALALLVGYRTRLATIATWALVVSLHNRNPALIFAGDDVLRALLFWAMFLPLGACYSIDSALNTSAQKLPKRILSAATLALTLQQCWIYMFSAAFKAKSSVWWPDGSAVYYALSYDQYVAHLGQFLLNFGPFLVFSTFVTFVLEWVGPLFLFVPFRTTFFRCCTIITFILLHIGFGLTLNLGIFPFLSVFSWLAFIPSDVWDAAAKRLHTPERAGLRINYDADCGFCKKVVHLIRTFLILPGTPLLLAQDDPSIYADMQAQNSWVIVDWQENRHFKWEAIAYVCHLSPLFRPLAPILRWKPLMAAGTKIYETIASNRRKAGMFTRPLKFRPIEVRPSLLLNIVTSLLLFYAFVWNIKSFVEQTYYRRTVQRNDWITSAYKIFNKKAVQNLDLIGQATRLDQSWSIFAPGPPIDDGWYVIPGKLKDGTEVDVLKDGGSVSWEKPTVGQRNAIYRNMQWRTFFINLNRSIGKKLYPYYGKYLCRDWNARHKGSKQLDSFEIDFMDEKTVPPGQPQTVQKTRKLQQSCSEQPSKDK